MLEGLLWNQKPDKKENENKLFIVNRLKILKNLKVVSIIYPSKWFITAYSVLNVFNI